AGSLATRGDPTAATLDLIFESVRQNPRRVVFAEGEEEKVIRAAIAFRNSGFGTPVLIGRSERIETTMRHIGVHAANLEIHNARLSKDNKRYADYLYSRLQRSGFLWRDCQRLVNQDRNVFAALMVACGDADGLVTGVTRGYNVALEDMRRVINVESGRRLIGVAVMIAKGHTVFVADTTVHDLPDGKTMADIAIEAAAFARQM